MTYHITESDNCFTVTDETNYFAFVQDARKVYTLWKSDWSLDDIIEYFIKYFEADRFQYHDSEGRSVSLTPDYIKPVAN